MYHGLYKLGYKLILSRTQIKCYIVTVTPLYWEFGF